MNLKQAKQHFTELTGLKANKESVLISFEQNKGTTEEWLAYAQDRYPEAKNTLDARTKEYWLSVIGYLKILISFQEPAITLEVLRNSFTELTGIPATKNAITKACSQYVWLALCVNETLQYLWHFETRKKEFWEYLLKRINITCTFTSGGLN